MRNITTDEEMTPSPETVIVNNMVTFYPRRLTCTYSMKQRYRTELRSQTLASLKPHIQQALDSLLDEINTARE